MGFQLRAPRVATGTKRAIVAAFLASAVFAGAREAHAQVGPDGGNKPYEWKYLFPIWGKRLAAKGMTFPYPFGVGVNYLAARQALDISNVRVALNDGEFIDLSKVVKFSNLGSNVQAANARFDLWVFPFINVYGLVNYLMSSETSVVLSEPFPLTAGAQQSGYGGGFGMTGAFGFLGFWGAVDANFTWNQLSKLDAPVRTFVFAPRVGKRLPLSKSVNLSLWVGAMRQDIQADTSGSIKLSEAVGGGDEATVEGQIANWARQQGIGDRFPTGGDPVIHYKLDKALADPWNMLVGMEANINQKVQVRTELGFFGRTQVLIGINYRFGFVRD
jgi:hypothetical protein